MRILFVGAGAVGGYFGSRLIAAGQDVAFLVRPKRAKALRRQGLRVAIGDDVEVFGDLRLEQSGAAAPHEAREPHDAVVVSVKGYALDAALNDIAPFVQPSTAIIPVLNGLRHMPVLVDRFGSAVLGGLAVVAASLDDDGTVRLLAPGASITFGELDGSASERVARLGEAFQAEGFTARTSTTIDADLWAKWVFLASGGALTTLVGGSIGEIMATPTGERTALAVIDEAAAVSRASGFEPNPRALAGLRRTLTEEGSSFTTSLYRDFVAGRPLETDPIIGDLVERATALDVPVPLFAAAAAHLNLKAMQRTPAP